MSGARTAAEPTPVASTDPVSPSLLPDTAAVDAAGRLSIGGVDVCELVEELGTPLFVYDEEHLRARCREAVDAFGGGAAYATKAFLCKAMARVALEEGLSLDVASAGELHCALEAGAPGRAIVLHGNNKSVEEIDRVLALDGARIVVDSFDEIERLAASCRARAGAPGTSAPAQVLVRVTPGVEAHTHEYIRTGQEDSKFGFSLASGAADAAIAALSQLPGVEVVGVHAHIGSQIFALEAFTEEVAALAPFIACHRLGELCVGGGLGVAYLNHERSVPIAAWREELRAACVRAAIPASVRLSAEPGRAIVASAAITCYRVGTIKQLPGIRTYVAVDGGMSDNPRPVLYGSGYEAFVPARTGAPRPLAARVVGKHCESGDVLVADARLPEDLAVGDILATPVTGAYGYSMASNYNRLPRPAVIFVAGGDYRIVCRRETVQDLLALEP